MKNEELYRILLLPKINYVIKEIKEIAYLIKQYEYGNEQDIINYEDTLNKYSNIDYSRDV